MIRIPSQIAVGKRDPSKRPAPKHLAGAWLAVGAVIEAGLRVDERVPPAVQDNASDVESWIEARSGKHLSELLPNPALVDAIWR